MQHMRTHRFGRPMVLPSRSFGDCPITMKSGRFPRSAAQNGRLENPGQEDRLEGRWEATEGIGGGVNCPAPQMENSSRFLPKTPHKRRTASFCSPSKRATSENLFFFNDTTSTEIFPLSLHDALLL